MTEQQKAVIFQAEAFLQQHPDALIGQFSYQNKQFWFKRRPFSKKTLWHTLQHIVSKIAQLPLFYPTVSQGGAESLHFEAARLRLFEAQGIAVPAVYAVTDVFLITEDTGQQLHAFLGKPENKHSVETYLKQAADCLIALHKAGLYHGRPSLKDMTLQDEILYFIDLEEDCLQQMSLEEAQARDIWLFFNSVANHASEAFLAVLFARFQENMSASAAEKLNKTVRIFKPLRQLASALQGARWGRDVRNALKANKVMEVGF